MREKTNKMFSRQKYALENKTTNLIDLYLNLQLNSEKNGNIFVKENIEPFLSLSLSHILIKKR